MASVLSSFFSRDARSQFAYDLPQSPVTSQNGVSIGHSFKKAEPNEKATVFWTMSADFGGGSLKQQAQKLRAMRHPNILTYLDSAEIDGKFYLVTEPCVPLALYMSDTSLTDEHREFTVSWGLYQVLSSLKFLHEANVSHEALRKAIYVTPAGDWKLACLDRSTAFTTPRNDLNQLALVIWEVFNGFREEMSKPEAPGRIPKRLQDLYKKMAGPGAQRISADELIRECRSPGGFFKNRFVDTLLFLEEFQLKENHEKQAFFTHLRDHLEIFPDDVAKYKILPKLILSYEYGDAGPNILIPLFKLGHLLDEAEYQRRIVPCLVKLFSSPDRTTRVKLLERIDEFAAHLTPQVLNEKIFTNLATGFMDTSPAVRESTVKAMVSLAEKLNTHNLNSELMKHLARLQGTDEHGGIRTNTTICLGKIGCYLEPSNRQKILIGAFTRGMKDPFPPARVAAVLALSATQQFYSLVEVANRVVPALGPLTCDPEKQVRDQAFKSLKGFLDKLEKASENPEIIPELEAQVKAGGKGLFGSDKVPQWASWALKSLSGKFYKGTPPPTTESESSSDGKCLQSSDVLSQRATTAGVDVATAKKTESDGWGELDDDFSHDEWSDAQEPAKTDDDWGTGWEHEVAATLPTTGTLKPTPAPVAKKPVVAKRGTSGGLKLGSVKPKEQSPSDDIDSLLGITSGPKKSVVEKFSTGSASSSAASGGWDAFEECAAESTRWDEWGSTGTTPVPAAKPAPLASSSSKDARRAELAARNEQRRRELAEKRTQRTVDKSASKPVTTSKQEDAGGWDDF